MSKSLAITITLSVLVIGSGHLYLGFVKRGIILLIVGIAAIVIWIYIPRFVPYPYGWLIIAGYWVWQIADARRLYRKIHSGTKS